MDFDLVWDRGYSPSAKWLRTKQADGEKKEVTKEQVDALWSSWGSSWALKELSALTLMEMKRVFGKDQEARKSMVLYETSNKPGGRMV